MGLSTVLLGVDRSLITYESPVSPLENAYAVKGSMKTNAMAAILFFMILFFMIFFGSS